MKSILWGWVKYMVKSYFTWATRAVCTQRQDKVFISLRIKLSHITWPLPWAKSILMVTYGNSVDIVACQAVMDVTMRLSPEKRISMMIHFINFIKKHFVVIYLIGKGRGKLISDSCIAKLFFHSKTSLLWNSHFSCSCFMQSVWHMYLNM